MRRITIVSFPLLIFFLIALGILSGFVLRIQEAQANTTGEKYPTLGESVAEDPWSDANCGWDNPTSIYADDGNTASVTHASFDSPDQTYVLKATGFDFSVIPDGSTINGVIVRVNSWYRSGQGSGSMDLLQLLDTSKAKVGTNQCATPVALTTTDTTIITTGSSTDLWGNALTAAWVKNANFGVAIGILATAANADVDVDYVTIEIYYTPPLTLTVASSVSQPPNVTTPSTDNVLGVASIVMTSGTGSVTAVTIKENGGSIDATNELENVELWLSSDKTWDGNDTQLDTAKSFTGGVDGTCTFNASFDVTTTTKYLIVRLDVKSGVTPDKTIEIQIQDITTTYEKSGLPCDLSGTTTVTADWWNGSWSYRKKLTFDNSAQSENLTNFPVLVKLTTSNFNYSDAKSDGTDLRFIDSDNSTELKYHIEKWNPSGDSFIWVRVPQIDGSSNTDYIYMYYGYADAPDVQDEPNAFSNNYTAVWHMDEASWNGTAGEVKDSTLNANDGTRVGDATTATAGQVNGCGTFDGNGDYVDVADSASLDVTNLTINAWVNSSDFTPSDHLSAYNRVIVSKTDGKVGYQLGLTTENKPYFAFEDISVNNVSKYNNTIPADGVDTGESSTDGRIPLGSAGSGDDNTVFPRGSIIKDGSTYKIWYTGNDGSVYRAFYATSPDGLVWTKYDNTIPTASDTTFTNGRLPLGTSGKGDDAHATCPTVIKDSSTYKMWYAGHDGTNYRIYYATSSDGLTWTKYDNSIPSASDTSSTNGRIPLGTDGTGDDTGAYHPVVIKDGSTYKMWYNGNDGTYIRTYYATSPDGLVWTKYDNTIPATSDTSSTNGRIPLGTDGKGDDYYAYNPTVIKDGSVYRMWYVGCDGPTAPNTRIYYATSPDGLVWTKYDNTVPTASDTTSTNGRIPLGTAGKGDDNGFAGVGAIKDGSTYKIWYGGHDESCYRIYYATIQTGVTSSTAVPSEFKMLSGVADTTADTIKLYVNGSLDTSGTTTVNGVNNSEKLTIGNLLNGKIDEVRVSTGTRSADWIAAQYLSMTCQFASFYTPTPADPQIQSTSHTDGAKSNVAIATFTCTAGTPTPDHYHYLWDQTATHTKAEVSAGTQWDGATLNKTCTSDGDWYLHAISHDASHNESINTDTFHIDYDGTAPQVNPTATAQNATTVRIVYNEAVKHVSASNSDDALNPDNYSIAPSLTVSSVVHVSGDTTFDLTTAEQTPSQSYTITITNVQDEHGNVIDPANDEATFTGFTPTITIALAVSQPSYVVISTTDNVMGVASIVRDAGTGQVTAVTLKENLGTIDADTEMANIELWLSSDQTWDAGDTQLDTAKTFDGVDGECTFYQNFDVTTTAKYLIIRADIGSLADSGDTIKMQIKTISTSGPVNGTPLDMGTSTVVPAIEYWIALPSLVSEAIKFGSTNANSVTYGNGKFVVVGDAGKASYSSDGINWTVLPAGTDTGIKFGTTNAYSVTYGSGKFVVVGDAGKASYSSDGINWTVLPAGTDTGIKFGTNIARSVTYGNDKFVVVGDFGKASYSSDGESWTVLPAGDTTGIKFGTTARAYSVTYGNGKFVVVGMSGKASYSSDGIDWTALTPGDTTGIKFGTTTYAYSVTYGNDKFVVVGEAGKASYSSDGINWTALTPGTDTGIKFGTTASAYSVTYGNGKFVVVGASGKASYSSDGIDWTALTPGTDTGIKFGTSIAYSVTYGNGKFVVVGASGKASYSSDGINWTALTPGTDTGIKFGTNIAYSVTYGNGKFVVVGDAGKASYSSDGINWTALTPGTDTGIKFGTTTTAYSVTYGNGKFVVVGMSGKASYSSDGINWTALTPGDTTGIKFGTTASAYSVTYGNGKFVVVGSSGKASYSSDGIDWTVLPAGDTTGIKFGTATTAYSVTYGNGKFVVVGASGKASYSSDGIDWTALTPGDTTGIKFGTATTAYSVTYGNGKFVVVGASGKASYSSDGINWTALTPGDTTGIKFGTSIARSVTYGNDKFVVVGTSGKASYSSDGINWTALTPGDTTGIKFGTSVAYSVTYGSDKFVAVGESGAASYCVYGVAAPADPQIQSSTHTDGAKSNVANATFTATAGTPTPDHYHYLWDQTATHTKAEVSAGTQWDGTTLNKTCTSDGDWYLHAISHDASHNESANTDTFHIDYDGTAPESVTTLSALTGTYSGEIELSWTSPGDDGWNNDFDSGSEFDIRYSTTAGESPAISTTTFSACSSVSEFSPIPTPVTALWPYSMTVTGLTPGTTYYFAMKTADDVLNWSGLSNGATTWAQIIQDTTSPAAITDLSGQCDSGTGEVRLYWATPGDDGWNNTLPDGSEYIIDYSTYSIAWSTTTFDVEISTSGVAPYTQVSHKITGLTGDTTWYFQIWTRDEVPTNWSGLSNGATVWVNPILSVSISTNTINLGVVEPNSYALTVSSLVVTNNGNIKQKFKLKIVSEPNATWESVTATSPGAEQYRYSGIFRSTQPATSDFLSEDSFSVSTERTSSSVDLARDADPDEQKGFNVSPDDTRNLWFKFEAPTSTNITTTQAIPLTVTAEPYP